MPTFNLNARIREDVHGCHLVFPLLHPVGKPKNMLRIHGHDEPTARHNAMQDLGTFLEQMLARGEEVHTREPVEGETVVVIHVDPPDAWVGKGA